MIRFVLVFTSSVPPLWYGKGHRRVHGFSVQVEAVGEGVQVGQVGRADGGNSFLKASGVSQARGSGR